ncbi:preprotein translocase subunit SecG [Legionella longbeachae]|uniref:Protein-export membrane protein SecG n=1 Tax=Legionella longbeachae serogroup 1 (strain NSW150) TaxID=661367 RepID=D3HNZ1_LEGLN|nr:preprotein translocase subunit SecG [Legionella longbeachae]VEE01131.1 protein-export membrane protein secG (preprotein translocase subunit) [Legionella oakridgensis]HBD7398428.1 preprotein translocase subunit SecG [Legionella pneumophila]ARB92492.1 preprotein translocase subunit SecG [Legionella longbeachae]ARM34328.1 preprotein translocase subunit SecG [Legionella longbeachae]EEZ96394.1 preprotein translocase SecG subunit [Legionella longbeachae D-4968]
MYQLILMIHVIVAVVLIGLVLIQHGKGADVGAAFGSGASNTLFGSQGTGGFLFKLTGGLALTFFVTSLLLSYLVSIQYQKTEQQVIPQQTSVPVNSIPVPIDNKDKNNK